MVNLDAGQLEWAKKKNLHVSGDNCIQQHLVRSMDIIRKNDEEIENN